MTEQQTNNVEPDIEDIAWEEVGRFILRDPKPNEKAWVLMMDEKERRYSHYTDALRAAAARYGDNPQVIRWGGGA